MVLFATNGMNRAIKRGFRWCLMPALLVLTGLGSANAQLDIGRLTMGRVTYPAKSWALDSFSTYFANDVNDPSRDQAQSTFEIERGQTDRFSWEIGLQSTRAQRDRLQLNRFGIGAQYRVLDNPAQLALFADYEPSLRKRADEVEFGFEALKNMGRAALLIRYEATIEKEPGEARGVASHIMVGPIYRLGLQGLTGVQWHHGRGGLNAINFVVGGAVSKHIFLSLQPQIGISRSAPDLKLMFELHSVFGAYALGMWGLE